MSIYGALVRAGMTAAGACGLMGNMQAESGMKSNIVQRGMTALSDGEYTRRADAGEPDFIRDGAGYGLCQWTYWSRKQALLGFAGTLTGAYLANRKTSALIAYRLEQLEKKVDKHNSVIERTFELEKRAALTTEQIKVANHRIDDLERGAQM